MSQSDALVIFEYKRLLNAIWLPNSKETKWLPVYNACAQAAYPPQQHWPTQLIESLFILNYS